MPLTAILFKANKIGISTLDADASQVSVPRLH